MSSEVAVQPTFAALNVALYVGDLERDVTEPVLFDMFAKIGPISSVRICRDAATRKSLGYGYVNFHNANDAEDALRQLNHTKIRGRPCRVMRSQRDPAKRKSQAGNLFIKGLDVSIDANRLTDLMSLFGSIESAKVPVKLDSSGIEKHCGYGFVQFSSEEEAKNAIAGIARQGGKLGGNDVTIEPYKRRDPQDPTARTNVYIKNLPATLKKTDFEEMLRNFGTLQSILLVEKEGLCKGYGYANFSANAEAQACIDGLSGKSLPGAETEVYAAFYKSRSQIARDRAQTRAPSRFPPGCNLYVKNLADDVDENALKEEFSKYGAITSCFIRRDPRLGVSLGFGFVCFESAEMATAAVEGIGRGYYFHSKPLFVGVAQTKAERAEFLRLNYKYMVEYRSNASMQNRPFEYSMIPQPFPGQPFGAFAPPRYPYANPPPPIAGANPGRSSHLVPYVAAPPGPFPAQRFPTQGYSSNPRPQRTFPPQLQQHQHQRQPAQAGRGTQGGQSSQQLPPQTRQQQQPPRQILPPAQPQPQLQQLPQQATVRPQLSAQTLANMPPEQAKRTIGEAIYPKIMGSLDGPQKARAGKITGMLLEALDITELLNLHEDNKALDEKLTEALRVLHDAETGTAQETAAT